MQSIIVLFSMEAIKVKYSAFKLPPKDKISQYFIWMSDKYFFSNMVYTLPQTYKEIPILWQYELFKNIPFDNKK